jgi:copper chaperone CopZ
MILLPLLFASGVCDAQIRNAQSTTVRIDGDCPMCEKTIEKVAFVKGEAEADWDVDAKTARITFDSTRTDVDAVLQRIAHAGYDNERYLAPDAAYRALPGCCQYERTFKRGPIATDGAAVEHSGHDHGPPDTDATQAAGEALGPVFDAYFALKDALVASDAKKAAGHASELSARVKAVPMEDMDEAVHEVWMEVMEPLANTSAGIATRSDLDKQRKAFAELTEPMLALVKAQPGSTPIYLDHCPMYEGGADWLSRDKAIRNPFYGAQMMSCGSIKETIAE